MMTRGELRMLRLCSGILTLDSGMLRLYSELLTLGSGMLRLYSGLLILGLGKSGRYSRPGTKTERARMRLESTFLVILNALSIFIDNSKV
jgi:hypothetical protein